MIAVFCAVSLSLSVSFALADSPQFPQNPTFTTVVTTPRPIEGLTGDHQGNLYTGGSGTSPCPVWEINLRLKNPPLTPVGFVVPAAGNCGFSGIAFNDAGFLFVADGAAATVYTFKPSATNPPAKADVYASGVPGTNGLAFDRDGNLWTGDGTTGQGRVWKIVGPGANCTPPNSIRCEEVFRIQPMRNGDDLGGKIASPGVGRQHNTVPVNNAQNLVANGIAFDHRGDMLVIDTARGALWKIQFDSKGNIESPVGCDTTFTENTLCLSNVFVAHPILEGGDGIALDVAGNVWVDANERNAVVVVSKDGTVAEAFRNPVNSAKLRNSADAQGNTHILEFPISPF